VNLNLDFDRDRMDAVATKAAAVMAGAGLVIVTAIPRFWADVRLLALSALFASVAAVSVMRIAGRAGYALELVGTDGSGGS